MNTEPRLLTRRQVRLVDELAVRELKMPSIVLMENAGRGAAHVIAERTHDGGGQVVVFCGAGNNGGDGFVIARHLHNAGRRVRCHLVGDPKRVTSDAGTNLDIVRAMEIPVDILADAPAIRDAARVLCSDDVIVDALLGTGFAGSVREPLAEAIREINGASKSAVVSIDVPSGLDCDTGSVGNVAVRADFTVTFVAAKCGFETQSAKQLLGQVTVVDIGAPPELVDKMIAVEPIEEAS